jgi:hypothetical protein
MNAPMHNSALLPAEALPITDSAALILHGDAMDRIERFAKMMAGGKLAVPRHFNGAPADCFAVCLQAMQWRMNPFAVAQKTFISPSGALGYEGTLVAAALSTSGALEGDLRYEFIGDWSKVRGKFEKRESQNRGNNNSEPKFYIVATYTKADEEGLGVRAIGRLRGERADRVVELYLSQCYPRFSTQWANNPEQQIIYAVDRVWARRHKPSVMLGVYTDDELGRDADQEKFMGPADEVGTAGADGDGRTTAGTPGKQTLVLPAFTEEDLTKRADKVRDFYTKGKDAETIIAFYAAKFTMPDAMKQRIRDMAPQQAATEPPADPATDVAPKVTYATLAGRLQKCTDADTAALIVDEGRALPADQQADLAKLFATQFPKE